MKDILLLYKISFDGLENKYEAARSKEFVAAFTAEGELSAQGKLSEYFAGMPPEKLYLGWDGVVYPIYNIEKVTANPAPPKPKLPLP